MLRRLSLRFALIPMLLLAVPACAEAPRALSSFVGAWSAEFSRPPLTRVVHGTIVFDSIATLPGGEVRLLGSFQLDSARQGQDDLVVALLGHPDGCVHVPGPVIAYRSSHDFLEIEFTPGAADCGLVGRVSVTTLTGRWQEPSYAGTRAEGELRISERASSQ